MRIGILVLMAGRTAGGPETYEVQLIRALASIDKKNEYIIYATGPEARKAIGVEQDNVRYRILKPAIRPISLTVSLPAAVLRDGVDFLHCTFTPPPLCPAPLVFTVHCLSSIVHPEFYKPFVAMRLNYLLRKGIKSASILPCVSRFTLQHVQEMFGIEAARMLVSYNGVDSRFRPQSSSDARALVRERLGIQRPWILYLGKLQKHKNIVRLLQAYDRFRDHSQTEPVLMLAGKMAGDSSGIEETIASMKYRQDVIRPGYLPDDVIPALYSGARMFAYPSLWEGFGIPIAEAMASGTPVLTSTSTCLPEIAAGAALTVDPLSTEEMADGLMRLDSDETLRQTLVQRGFRRAAEFTWDNCARVTLDAYSRIN